MGQPSFFDVSNRYASLDARKDLLVQIAAVVPFEEFRSRLEAVWRKPGERRKSAAGRKPWDAVVMLKAIILCELYTLSDEQVEYQVRDRLSFMRFPGLGLEDPVPDARTIRLYREQLARAGEVKPLFSAFDDHLKGRGSLAMGGQIIDASIVPVPRQRNKPLIRSIGLVRAKARIRSPEPCLQHALAPCNWITWMQYRVDHLQGMSLPKPQENRR